MQGVSEKFLEFLTNFVHLITRNGIILNLKMLDFYDGARSTLDLRNISVKSCILVFSYVHPNSGVSKVFSLSFLLFRQKLQSSPKLKLIRLFGCLKQVVFIYFV